MALTRKFLKALGIEDDKIDQIIEAHTDVTDALKKERDGYKENASKYADVQKELDEANKKVAAFEKDDYKGKYEKEHADFAEYKKGVEAAETKAKKSEAYKAVLKKAGVSEKRYDAIIRLTNLDEVELDDKGEVKDADKAIDAIKKDWSDYIVTTDERGADTENPPKGNGGNNGGAKSRAALIGAKHNEMLYGVKGDDK